LTAADDKVEVSLAVVVLIFGWLATMVLPPSEFII